MKALVTTRHHSPWSTSTGAVSSSLVSGEEKERTGLTPASTAETAVATATATLIAMSTRVTVPQRRPATRTPVVRLGCRTVRRASAISSGHWKPTEAGCMHSGQMGRPQRTQEIRVGRSGCR